jgi:hypothetical protein
MELAAESKVKEAMVISHKKSRALLNVNPMTSASAVAQIIKTG